MRNKLLHREVFRHLRHAIKETRKITYESCDKEENTIFFLSFGKLKTLTINIGGNPAKLSAHNGLTYGIPNASLLTYICVLPSRLNDSSQNGDRVSAFIRFDNFLAFLSYSLKAGEGGKSQKPELGM